MMPGQCCLCLGDKKVPGHNHRMFGVIDAVGRRWITIRLADGRLIRREPASVATYVQPPANWPELYAAMERVVPRLKAVD